MKLSVVIPTLGGIPLINTIKALQNSSIRPIEILVCIPLSCELVTKIDLSDNIRIIRTKKKSQVHQRMLGFLESQGELVLQIDDDVILEKDTIKKLVYCLEGIDEKAAVAPSIFWEGSKISVFSTKRDSFIRKFSDWIMNGKNGYKSGVVSLSGVGFGLDHNDKNQDITETEWLPGGCVLHRSHNLINIDYFPFSGKAYSEDLIHSFLLRENGVKLYVCNNAIAYIESIFYPDSLIELFRQYQASKYVVKIQRKGFVRLHLLYALRLFKMVARFINRVVKMCINKIKKII